MRTIIFIISFLFSISCLGQVHTAITKTKCSISYDDGKFVTIKAGKEIVITSEHIGNNHCKVSYKGKGGTININDLVMNSSLDSFLFDKERKLKAKIEAQRAAKEKFQKLSEIYSPIILPRLKDKSLTYKGIITKRVELLKNLEAKANPYSTVAPTYLNQGDSVAIFYYHKDENKRVAGVTTTYSCGFIDATCLLMDSVCIDSLHYINKADKDKCALEFRFHRLAEIDNYMLEIAKQKKEAERQEKIAKQNERFNKGYLIEIERLYFEMNSAGLLEPYIRITNNSSKDIKYITFNFYWKNRVDDVLTNSINRSETHSLCELTGYIKGYESSSGSWDTSFYNTTAETIHISSISIIYRDGSRRTIGSQKCKELVQTSK